METLAYPEIIFLYVWKLRNRSLRCSIINLDKLIPKVTIRTLKQLDTPPLSEMGLSARHCLQLHAHNSRKVSAGSLVKRALWGACQDRLAVRVYKNWLLSEFEFNLAHAVIKTAREFSGLAEGAWLAQQEEKDLSGQKQSTPFRS